MRILITSTSLCRDREHPALEPLRAIGELVFNETGRPMTADELADVLPDVDGVLAGVDDFSADAFVGGDRLRVVSRFGVGTDRVDLAAAERVGVVVARTPGANAIGVAELAVGLMFSVARGIPRLDADVRAGGWPRGTGIELRGRTLAILGVGAIGRIVAEAARGIGMHVLGYDPFVADDDLRALGIEPVTLDDAFARGQVFSLHLPLTPQTRGIVSAERIAGMRQDAIIVNTARGGLIDEDAARAALDDGRLWGIGLDAYEVEPPTDSVLVGHQRVVSTPHSGGHTQEAVERTAEAAVSNIVEVLAPSA